MLSTDKKQRSESLPLQCGSCSFLTREKIFEQKCLDLGKLPSSKACRSHTADVFSLIDNYSNIDLLEALASIIHGFNASDLKILAAIALSEHITRKAGFHFFQKVYLRIKGGASEDFFSNFVSGHVLDADKERVRVVGIGEERLMCVYAINDPLSHTLYKVDRFEALKEKMFQGNYFKAEQTVVGRVIDLGEADEKGLIDTPYVKKKLKRAVIEHDLVHIVKRLSEGKNVRRTKYDDDKEISIT